LNLLLRKHVMYHGDHNQQIFYSPWRRSLRPLRGILHATFTFTMGALLFERLSSWAETKQGMKQWKAAGLTQRDLIRARFRCLEEIESVRYSIQNLEYAGGHLKWLTAQARLVGSWKNRSGMRKRASSATATPSCAPRSAPPSGATSRSFNRLARFLGRCGWGRCKQADLPGSLFLWEGWGIISTMKRPALKVRKATVSKAGSLSNLLQCGAR
jgi:hypothetical protein